MGEAKREVFHGISHLPGHRISGSEHQGRDIAGMALLSSKQRQFAARGPRLLACSGLGLGLYTLRPPVELSAAIWTRFNRSC